MKPEGSTLPLFSTNGEVSFMKWLHVKIAYAHNEAFKVASYFVLHTVCVFGGVG